MKTRASHIVTIFSFGAIFLCALLLWIFAPRSNIAEEENRSAAELPQITARSIWEGDFFEDFSRYISDSFPLRKKLISANSKLRLLAGECEVKNVFRTGDTLIFKGEYPNLDVAKSNLFAISDMADVLSLSNNASITFAIIPRSCDVNADKLPRIYSTERSQEIYRSTDTYLPDATALRRMLFKAISNTDNAFYRTDHHLTTEGAYAAYKTIIEYMGYHACDQSHFTKEIVTEEFLGTAESRTAIDGITPDSITLFRYDGDDDYYIYSHASSKELPLYDFTALDKKDKYQIFLGGNHAFLSIEKKQLSRPRLLIIKDSFANAMLPFLAVDFDLDVIDPRYSSAPVSKLIGAKKYDGIIFIFGADTLATTAIYDKLK
jgi:hypothetical protein